MFGSGALRLVVSPWRYRDATVTDGQVTTRKEACNALQQNVHWPRLILSCLLVVEVTSDVNK